jgi:hypothetical protein
LRSIDHSNSLASFPSRGFRAGIFDVSISVAGELSLVVSWDFDRRSAFVRVIDAQSKSFALRFPLYRGQHLSLPRFGPIQFFPVAISSCSRFPIMTVGPLVAIRVSIYHSITGFRTASQPSFTIPPPLGVQLRNTQGPLFGDGDLLPHPRLTSCPRHCVTPLKGAQRVNEAVSAWPEGRDVINS